jgi:hypothetical protein
VLQNKIVFHVVKDSLSERKDLQTKNLTVDGKASCLSHELTSQEIENRYHRQPLRLTIIYHILQMVSY